MTNFNMFIISTFLAIFNSFSFISSSRSHSYVGVCVSPSVLCINSIFNSSVCYWVCTIWSTISAIFTSTCLKFMITFNTIFCYSSVYIFCFLHLGFDCFLLQSKHNKYLLLIEMVRRSSFIFFGLIKIFSTYQTFYIWLFRIFHIELYSEKFKSQ